MKSRKLPQIDSIEELARFWDTHDLTDYEEQLKEVTEPVFVRRGVIPVPLEPRELEAINHIAKDKGVAPAELIRGWVVEKLS
jgi:hypothetical protein